MPQLQENPAAAGVNRVGRQPPARDHGVGVDAGRLEPAIRLLGNGGRLGDKKAGRTSLGVVFGHQGIGNPAGAGPRPGKRCHHDAVGQREITKLEGLEKA